MFIWGGQGPGGKLADGYALDETSLMWSAALPTAPTARRAHTAVVDGSKMIIWGGGVDGGSGYTNTGAIFDASAM